MKITHARIANLALTKTFVAAAGLLILSGCLSTAPRFEDPPGTMHDTMHNLDSEYRFLVEMIPHHQEAVDTSRETAARTSRPELREFALTIARDQTEEIRMMKEWLASWYPGRPTDASYRPMMRPVEGLSADRADRAFLEDMIMHHRMAVMMAVQIRSGRLSERPELLKLADDIIRSQNGEIEQMEKWLRDWYGVTGSGHMMQ